MIALKMDTYPNSRVLRRHFIQRILHPKIEIGKISYSFLLLELTGAVILDAATSSAHKATRDKEPIGKNRTAGWK